MVQKNHLLFMKKFSTKFNGQIRASTSKREVLACKKPFTKTAGFFMSSKEQQLLRKHRTLFSSCHINQMYL